jgi:rod shape-determining protein MreD
MFRKVILFLILIILAAAQISFFPHFFYRNISPDILLLVIVIWSARNGFEKIWIWAIISGLVLDALLLDAPGANALSFLLAAYLSGFLVRRYLTSQRTPAFFMALGLSVFGVIINYLILSLLIVLPAYFFKSSSFQIEPGFFFGNLGLKIVYNLILFLFVYSLARKMEFFLKPSSEKIFLK